MMPMSKKNEGRFNVQFDVTNPEHLVVIDVLEGKRPRGKATYIADAILHYENCSETPVIRATPAMDEKMIEAVVHRLLSKMSHPEYTATPPDEVSASAIVKKPDGDVPDNASVDAAINALGADNIQAIMGAVNAFRK